ncbi:MAG: sigma 54-interacting transcriptional regulator [Candidatus Acidiferrales bacterium]
MTPQDSKQKGNILVIHDEPANLDLLATILTEQGYAVCLAKDGESGLQLVKCKLQDLVLVDISMQGMNGYQVCASLKNDPVTRNIPLILIVPISHTINQPKAMLSGSVDYIASPFDAQEVLWRVETHLSLHRLRANLESAIRGRATNQTVTCEELEGALREALALTRITGRKHAEEKLRERESELRQILNLAPQHIAVLGPEGSRLFANQASLDYYGLTLESWRGGDPGRFLHPDDLKRMASVAQHTDLSNASAHDAEVRLLRKDGMYRWFLIRRHALLDGRGDLLRWYVAATDIEDRKQAEERLQTENIALREEIDKASMFEEIVGNSPHLQTVLSRVAKVAPTESTVLVTGETGTGKELVARAIHRLSRRSQRAFVSMNCAAVPRDLIGSELFGHEKGAFTGATQRRLGRFELAEGGTIFLDEVGDLPPDMQVALLRVLQEREFERVGGAKTIRVDVRVITATNRDLTAAVASGSFRQDLFYRLNVFPIEVPPLRDRAEDILMLVEYFVQRYARRAGKNFRSIDKKTLGLLHNYDWPGNIRELQNVIERSVILNSGEVFAVDESWLSRQPPQPRPRVALRAPLHSEPRSEKEIIEAALAECRGRVAGRSGAAAKLGVPPSTLEHRIQALRIDKTQFKFR